MRLNKLLDGLLTNIGGQDYQTLKLQLAATKASQTTGGTGKNATGINSTVNNPFLAALNSLTPTTLPTPPADPANAEQLSLYNQQLLQYISRMNAQQGLTSQRLAQQIAQLTQALQQNARNGNTASAGNNTQYPSNSSLSQLSGVVNSQPDSLLFSADSKN